MTMEKVCANVVVGILLAACYFLLPVVMVVGFATDWIVFSIQYVVDTIDSVHQATISRSVGMARSILTIAKVVWLDYCDIVLTMSFLFRQPIVCRGLFWEWMSQKLRSGSDQQREAQAWTPLNILWDLTKTRGALGTHQGLDVHAGVRTQAEELIAYDHSTNGHPTEELPIQESVQEATAAANDQPVGEPEILEIPQRVRTQEEQRLLRCIESLGVIEAQGLPEATTTEDAILLTMTRLAAANGSGIVSYLLSEQQGPYLPNTQPVLRKHQILSPHNVFFKLHTSHENIFRTDDPDCAICYSPLIHGEAMITHDTCRRTFHAACYEEALRRSTTCPFDREKLVRRYHSPPRLTTSINADPAGETLPQNLGNHRPTPFDVAPAPARPQQAVEQPPAILSRTEQPGLLTAPVPRGRARRSTEWPAEPPNRVELVLPQQAATTNQVARNNLQTGAVPAQAVPQNRANDRRDSNRRRNQPRPAWR